MTFLCLGYRDEADWDALGEAGRAAFREECRAYDDELRRCGHVVGAEAIPSDRDAVTLRHRDGRVAVTDGPCPEPGARLGSVLILEARDLNHAIHLVLRHPGVRRGAVEICATDGPLAAPIGTSLP